MEVVEPKLLYPGDKVDLNDYFKEEQEIVIKLGPGLIQQQNYIEAINCGILNFNLQQKRFWLDFNLKRYVPNTGDPVIGVITKRMGEAFLVDIGAASKCNLSAFAFENSNKKTKPNFQVGTLLYGRIVLAHKDMEPEMECFNSNTNKAEGYGELKNGFVFNCSIQLCRRLLNPKNKILSTIGSNLPYEIAIGLNGTIWLNSESDKITIKIKNAILNAQFIKDEDEDNLINVINESLEEI